MQGPARAYWKAALRPLGALVNFAAALAVARVTAAAPEPSQHRVEDIRGPRAATLTARR